MPPVTFFLTINSDSVLSHYQKYNVQCVSIPMLHPKLHNSIMCLPF